jgi:predicted enzyme related to lactoylglutathione lyase
MITGVRKIVVPVDDQERAKRFWTETIGFEATLDQTYGGERWVEVTPPDRQLVLVLSPRPAGPERREVPDQLPQSDIFFHCDDVQQTYQELVARGVKFPAPPAKLHFGWWALFEDNDGPGPPHRGGGLAHRRVGDLHGARQLLDRHRLSPGQLDERPHEPGTHAGDARLLVQRGDVPI